MESERNSCIFHRRQSSGMRNIELQKGLSYLNEEGECVVMIVHFFYEVEI
jgi:hypothetical protein